MLEEVSLVTQAYKSNHIAPTWQHTRENENALHNIISNFSGFEHLAHN